MQHLQVLFSLVVDVFPSARNSVNRLVALCRHPFRIILQPAARNLQSLSLSHLLVFLLLILPVLLGRRASFPFALFLQNRHKQTFASRNARNESVNREVGAREVAGDVPCIFYTLQCHHFSAKFLAYPGYVFLIFVCIEGAGRVNQDTAWLQTVPDIRYDFALQLPAVVHILGTPFADSPFIFAEHSFAGAGNIGKNHIKLQFRFLVIAGIVVGNNHIRMTELLYVLGKNLRAGAHRFVAEEQTPFRQGSSYGSRLSARGCTEI